MTLFVIAINPLLEVIDPEVARLLYVDDLTIYFSHQDIEVMNFELQQIIDEMSQHAEHIGFTISESKFKCIYFCRKRVPHDDPVVLHNNKLVLS